MFVCLPEVINDTLWLQWLIVLIVVVNNQQKAVELSSDRMPACCAEGEGSNPGWGAHRLSISSSSAETQQPVDRMGRKARGCFVLSVLY